jgi:flagellar biosynthetic protein FliR
VVPDPSIGQFVLWIVSEAALGAGIGLAVGFVSEAFAVGAQAMALQAGFAFASTIDPTTQADSTVLAILSQLTASMLFFAAGLHREVIRIFARSLETYPAGSFVLSHGVAERLVRAGSMMFSTGIRLALPVVATLIMIDIAIALLGRINAQLHLGIIAFPAKMIVGLALLGWVAALFPSLFRATAESALRAAQGMFTR